MATISKILKKRIASDIAASPLQESEFRPLAKMAGYFISLIPIWENAKPMFDLDIDGKPHHIFYRPR